MSDKKKWRTSQTPPDCLDYEDYTGEVSEVDKSCHEPTEVTIARILRGERVLGTKNEVFDDSDNPTRKRGYDWADADRDAADIADREAQRVKQRKSIIEKRKKATKSVLPRAGAKAAVKPAASETEQAGNDAARSDQ